MSRALKVLIVGAQEVGKTSLLRNFNDLEFDAYYAPTPNSDFSVKEIRLGSTLASIQFWDIGATAVMGRSFLRGTHGVLFVFDVTSPDSLENLNPLYEKVVALANFADNSFPCVLIANKIDRVQDRKVTAEDVKRWCQARRPGAASLDAIQVYEASSKTGEMVQEAFEMIAKMSLDRPAKLLSNTIVDSSRHSAANSDISSFSGKKSFASAVTTNPPRSIDSHSEAALGEQATSGDDIPTAKVIMAGAAAVGKTLILQRFMGDRGSDLAAKYEPTIGADFRLTEVPAKDKSLKLQIWDSAGDLRQQRLGRAYYKHADCLILVFDITSKSSFELLDSYWDNYLTYSETDEPDEFPALLIGNKSDLSDQRANSIEDILTWCANKRPRKPITYIGK